MKKLAYLLFLISLLSCEEEPYSPKTITAAETEGWPLQRIDLIFDSNNQQNVNFKVKLGNRELRSEPRLYGLAVILPSLTTEEVGDLVVETPGGKTTVVQSFKIKPKPSVAYVSSTVFAHRIPLKIVLSDWSYVYSPISENSSLQFKSSNYWVSAYSSFNGDTLEVRNPGLTPGETPYQYNLYINRLSYNPELNIPSDLDAIQNILLGSFTYKPSFQKRSASGKVGDRLEFVFNDTNYFPDQLTVKLTSTSSEGTLIYKAFNYVSAPGYINAMFGSFEIPILPAGNYKISVSAPNGVTYLSEDLNSFTVIQ